MSGLVTNIGLFFTWLITQAGSVITLITENSILLIIVAGFAISGFVLGWVSRLFRAN